MLWISGDNSVPTVDNVGISQNYVMYVRDLSEGIRQSYPLIHKAQTLLYLISRARFVTLWKHEIWESKLSTVGERQHIERLCEDVL